MFFSSDLAYNLDSDRAILNTSQPIRSLYLDKEIKQKGTPIRWTGVYYLQKNSSVKMNPKRKPPVEVHEGFTTKTTPPLHFNYEFQTVDTISKQQISIAFGH